VVRSSNAALAIVFVGAHKRYRRKHQKARQNSGR
jgi:hypothetical protein